MPRVLDGTHSKIHHCTDLSQDYLVRLWRQLVVMSLAMVMVDGKRHRDLDLRDEVVDLNA